jgi:flagellar hook protein FlgE
MSGELSTIQSLKAVDAWIDVINANINGGVRTSFKSARLKFSGSNVDVSRAGTSSSLPLQFPESGLTTANTIIDFSQGAVTASTENTHLAIQGEGFFLLISPDAMDATTGVTQYSANAKFFLTRDGEFRTNQNGLLVSSNGYYLIAPHPFAGSVPRYSTTNVGAGFLNRAVFNNIDNTNVAAAPNQSVPLSEFITGGITHVTPAVGGAATWGAPFLSLVQVPQGKQSLQFSQFGSTVYDFGFKASGGAADGTVNPNLMMTVSVTDATILSKSLEASNASMTQSVPELSLAQKLFSALTKVLQTKQTNVDGVLNLVR